MYKKVERTLDQKILSRAVTRFEDIDDLDTSDMTPVEYGDYITTLRDSEEALAIAFRDYMRQYNNG